MENLTAGRELQSGFCHPELFPLICYSPCAGGIARHMGHCGLGRGCTRATLHGQRGTDLLKLRRHSRYFILGLVAAGISMALACAGGGDNGGGDSPNTAPNDSGGAASQPETAATLFNSSLSTGSAVVQIGDKTYEFDMSGALATQCLTFFGVVGGAGQAADGADVTLSIEVPPENYKSDPRLVELDPPSLRVKDDDNDQDWRAGDVDRFSGANAPGPNESQVDSYKNDGKSASGTATFMDISTLSRSVWDDTVERPDAVKGTFEINCG